MKRTVLVGLAAAALVALVFAPSVDEPAVAGRATPEAEARALTRPAVVPRAATFPVALDRSDVATGNPHPSSHDRDRVVRANGMLLEARAAVAEREWLRARDLLDRHAREHGPRHATDRRALALALACDEDAAQTAREAARTFLREHPEARFSARVRRSCNLVDRHPSVIRVGS